MSYKAKWGSTPHLVTKRKKKEITNKKQCLDIIAIL